MNCCNKSTVHRNDSDDTRSTRISQYHLTRDSSASERRHAQFGAVPIIGMQFLRNPSMSVSANLAWKEFIARIAGITYTLNVQGKRITPTYRVGLGRLLVEVTGLFDALGQNLAEGEHQLALVFRQQWGHQAIHCDLQEGPRPQDTAHIWVHSQNAANGQSNILSFLMGIWSFWLSDYCTVTLSGYALSGSQDTGPIITFLGFELLAYRVVHVLIQSLLAYYAWTIIALLNHQATG